MSLTLPSDGIANKANDDRKWNPENHKQLDRRECEPLQPELQWEVDTQNTDQEQGANRCPPLALEEQVLRFFPHHGPDVAHLCSSSIMVKNTSSRLALPRRTSSISAPACTSRLTSGPILLSPRSSRRRLLLCTSAWTTSGRSRSLASICSVKPSPTISACGPPILARSSSGAPTVTSLPWRITPTWAQSFSASLRLCVLRKTVTPSRATRL